MDEGSDVVFSVEKIGITESDLNEIWRKYFKIDDAALCQSMQIFGRVRPFAENRVGYLGDHFILELKTHQSAASLEVFLKTSPSGIPALSEYLQLIGTARKESNMYREVLKKMNKFSRFAPQCFLAANPGRWLLVLEDVQRQGFRTVANLATGIFDRRHLECALVTLAKFHSASMLLEIKHGESLPLLAPGVLEENSWVRKKNNPRMAELDNAIDLLLALVRVIEKDNPQLDTILAKLPAFMLQIYDLVKSSLIHRNVACHGDLWAGNMVFRYDVTGVCSVPVECLIIDFQFARYAPPAYDVNMLITLTTTDQSRRADRDELIRFYYLHVIEEMKRHPSVCPVPEDLFPEQPFLNSCGLYRTSGLIENFLMNHVTLLPRRYVNRIFASAESYNSFSGKAKIEMCLEVLQNDAVYRERMTGIIRDLIEAL